MTPDYTVTIQGVNFGLNYTGDSANIAYEWDTAALGEAPPCPHCADWLGTPERPLRAWVMNGDRIGHLQVWCHSCAELVGDAKENRR